MQESALSRRGLLAGLAALALPGRLLATGGPKRWDGGMEVAVDVTIATVEGVRVHRPYVAVYVQDKDGKPVRTLSLWVQTERRGPKWIPDLRRWWRDEPDHDKLVQTVSSATRGAGRYGLVWDGKDDAGKPVPQGRYTILVEAAREHGTYGVISKEMEFAKKPVSERLAGNPEIESVAVEYRKRAK